MNTLTVNGTALAGIYIDASQSFNKPEKRSETFAIPGRSGDLLIDEQTFANVVIPYPCYERGTFPAAFNSIVNMLSAIKGYMRVECSNDPTHYRLGRFIVPEAPTAKRVGNKDGYFNLSWDCKPQRFLISGDEPVTVDFDSYKIAENSEPYIFRKAGGSSDIGDADRAKVEQITGGTIAWNQQIAISSIAATQTVNGVTFTNNGDGSITVTGTATAQARFVFLSKTWAAHKYLLRGCPSGGSVTTYTLAMRGQGNDVNDNGNGAIWNATGNQYKGVCIYILAGTTVNNLVFRPQLFDLTAMFGATIADYIYSVEQATAGAGVALAKKWANIVKPYYPYDVGSLVSVNTAGRKVVGFNQWDEEWEAGDFSYAAGTANSTTVYFRSKNYIQVTPNATLYIKSPSLDLFFYDGAKTYLGMGAGLKRGVSNRIVTVPSGAMYMRFCTATSGDNTYQGNICINLSDESKNGTYEPYTSQTYAIPSADLRGIPKLNGTEIEYDGDTLSPNGTINRKYGIVDLGTLDWRYVSNKYFQTYSLSGLILKPLQSVAAEFVCPVYTPVAWSDTSAKSGSMAVNINGLLSCINSAYTDAATFKTAMSGVYLVYELATPTTETVSTYEEVQNVYAGGTEEFIDERTVAVPVGHTTDYFNGEGYQLTNPTNFPAKPLIRVYGNGSVRVGDTIATVQNNADGYIDIDCELMDCFRGTTNLNADVTFSGNDFPVLNEGSNNVTLGSGITQAIITPRWWEL